MRLAIVVLPVRHIDRAKAFYRSVGFREDVDYASGPAFRIVRLTPPGSETSIIFGAGITSSEPGSVQGMVLTVRDLARARAELAARGVDVSEVFHDAGGVFCHLASMDVEVGPDPEGRDRASFARFDDPDGNGWIIQEDRRVAATSRGRFDSGDPWSDPWWLRARGAPGPRTLGES